MGTFIEAIWESLVMVSTSVGRPAAMTRIGAYRVHQVRARGGNLKERAIRLEQGTYAWGSEAVNKNARIIEVVYNASNNELVRTNTLVKGAVVNIDATPFSQLVQVLLWRQSHQQDQARPPVRPRVGEEGCQARRPHCRPRQEARQVVQEASLVRP